MFLQKYGSVLQLDGLASHQADRDPTLCGKTRGGGLCVYINTDCCNNSVLVSKSCSSLVECAVVWCRPFYLQRELSSLHIVALWIPPSAYAEEVLAALYGTITDLENKHPEGLIILTRDFNHANLKAEGRTCWTLFTPPYPVHTGPSPAPTLDTQTTPDQLTNKWRPSQKEQSLPFRTVLSALCTQHQLLTSSASALMMLLSSRPSPHAQTRGHGWLQRNVHCWEPET